jgi:hypothetical protein
MELGFSKLGEIWWETDNKEITQEFNHAPTKF